MKCGPSMTALWATRSAIVCRCSSEPYIAKDLRRACSNRAASFRDALVYDLPFGLPRSAVFAFVQRFVAVGVDAVPVRAHGQVLRLRKVPLGKIETVGDRNDRTAVHV